MHHRFSALLLCGLGFFAASLSGCGPDRTGGASRTGGPGRGVTAEGSDGKEGSSSLTVPGSSLPAVLKIEDEDRSTHSTGSGQAGSRQAEGRSTEGRPL